MSEKSEEENNAERIEELIKQAECPQPYINGATTVVSNGLSFDPDRFALPQDFSDEAGEIVLLDVTVGKPGPQSWVRFHPSEDYRRNYGIVKLDESRETYLVLPHLYHKIPKFLKRVTIYVWVSYTGRVGLWPVRLEVGNRRADKWAITGNAAVKFGMPHWVQIESLESGGYKARKAPFLTREPKFPTEPYPVLLNLGFKDMLIEDEDHPVLKELLGREG